MPQMPRRLVSLITLEVAIKIYCATCITRNLGQLSAVSRITTLDAIIREESLGFVTTLMKCSNEVHVHNILTVAVRVR